MRWFASLASEPAAAAPALARSDWSCCSVGELRLWHDQSGPATGVCRVDVPGCTLLVIGCCTATEADLRSTARQLARGVLSALDRLDGSQTVLVIRPDEILVVGDLVGQCVTFYATTDVHPLVLGSHVADLAELAARTPNRSHLAARLLVPELADVWWTSTPWEHVHAVQPGAALRWRRDGTLTAVPIAELPTPDHDLPTGGIALRAALQRAVGHRVGAARRPTADLSGGLDSSTIAVLAACDHTNLGTLTMATPGVEDAGPATAIAAEVPGLRHEVVDMPVSLLPYADLDQAPVLDEPDPSVATFARERWWLQQVAARGSDLHLSGDGGDGVLLAPPAYLADLAVPHRFGQLWRHATGWARLRHQAPHALLRKARATRQLGYAPALRQAARALERSPSTGAGWAGRVVRFALSGAAAWLTPDALRLVADMLREHADEHRQAVVPGDFGIGDTAAWLSLNSFARSQRLYHEMADGYGVHHQAPYLDDGVVRACWSVPAWVRTSPERAKPLLADAVRGVVPRCLVERRSKGDYTELAYRGLARNGDLLHDIFTRSRMAQLGLLDERRLLADLRRAIAGIPSHLGIFDAVLGTELWLRAQEDQVSTVPILRNPHAYTN